MGSAKGDALPVIWEPDLPGGFWLLHFMGITAREADYSEVKTFIKAEQCITLKEELPLHQQKRDYLAVKPILYTKTEIVEFSRGLIRCECVSSIKPKQQHPLASTWKCLLGIASVNL